MSHTTALAAILGPEVARLVRMHSDPMCPSATSPCRSPRRAGVRVPSVVVAIVALAAVGSACAGGTVTSAPPPTVGLSTDLGNGGRGDVTANGADLGRVGPNGAIDLGGRRADDAEQVDTIVMIGDSITAGAHQPLVASFDAAGFDEVRIDAVPGKRIGVGNRTNAAGTTVAAAIRAADDPAGQLWVIALGTNDIGQYAAEADVAALVDQLLAVVPGDVPLVWVDTYWSDRPDGTAMVNEQIRDAVEARGNAVVASWSAVAATNGVLTGDGVHPTGDGNLAFASLVVGTVRAFLGR